MFSNLTFSQSVSEPKDYIIALQVNPKGNQSCIFIGRTDAEAETPKVWPPDVKNRLIGKDPEAGENWRQKGEGGNKKMRGLDSFTYSIDMNLSKLQEIMKD